MREAIETFHACLMEGDYYRGHDVLEHPWRALPRGEASKDILRSLINGAVTLVLIQKGRPFESYSKTWSAFQQGKVLYGQMDLTMEQRLQECAVLLEKGYDLLVER